MTQDFKGGTPTYTPPALGEIPANKQPQDAANQVVQKESTNNGQDSEGKDQN